MPHPPTPLAERPMGSRNLLWLAAIAGSALTLMPCGDLALAQTAEVGQPSDAAKIFATSCGWCHQGGGRVPGRGPKLAGTDKSDEFIVNRIKNGKAPVMPAFGRSFNDEQIQAIIAYIRGLQDAP